MTIIKLDGIRMELKSPDLDNDGRIGGIESVQQNIGNSDIIQPTELGEAMKVLDDDTIEPGSRMSKIDMNTRLHPFEINSILAMDTLVALRVLPVSCLAFTRQKKRLNVSLNGKGREEKVSLASGKKEHDEKMGQGGMMNGLKSFMGVGK